MATKSSIMEIQNLIINPKSQPIKSNSEQFQFLLSMFPAKINDKLQIKKKNYFEVVFPQRDFFLKTLTKYNYKGLRAFKCQRYRVDWPSNQILFNYYKLAKINQSNCSNHL